MELSYNLRLFKEIFFPRLCAVCHQEIDTGLVCSSCRKGHTLQKVVLYGAGQASWQRLCQQGQPLVIADVLDRSEYLYRYDGAFKEALHGLKFAAQSELLTLLKEEAELGLKDKKQQLLRHYDYVTCVPTSPERRKERGFDVPEKIFASLQPQTLLQRVKGTAPLFTMAAEERRTELLGCFKMLPGADVKSKRVLLCDDIYTTGSTMQEAACVLLAAGAKAVGALTLCASKDNWDV